jgi:hypothetical protein
MKTIIRSLVVVSSLAALAGCAIDSTQPAAAGDRPAATPATATTPSDPMAPAPTPSAGMAIVRVIHASADAPAVDVYAKGSDKPLVTGLAYGQTSGWLEVPPAAYEFELRAAPSKPTDPIAYKTGALTIPAGAKISAVAAGLLGSQDSDSTFRVVPVVEGFGPAVVGSARLRVLHAGADAPSVDLDVGNDDPSKPEVSGLARFADTGADGVALPAGKALAVGIAAGGARVTSFTTPKLPEGANVLVIATGLLGKLARERSGFALLAVGPNGSIGFVKQDPRVYALHASPDAPRVDAFVGNAEIVDNIGFGELSKPIQVAPGSYTIDLFAHADGAARPAGEPAAASTTPMLEAGERYLTVATGFLSGAGGKPIRLESYREGFALDTGKAQLRAIHSSPDATEVDIGLAGATKIDPVLFGGLAFTKASTDEGLGAAAGHLPIGITPAGYNSTLVARFTLPAASTQRAFVIAGGALSAHLGQTFRLFVVDTAASPWTVSTALPH